VEDFFHCAPRLSHPRPHHLPLHLLCNWWRTTAPKLLPLITFSPPAFYQLSEKFNFTCILAVSVSLDAGESIFRLLGVFIIGKFITDLHSIFANPMTTLSASNSPVLPLRVVSRASSMNVSEAPSPGSAACSRTQSMNATGDGVINSVGVGGPFGQTMSVPRAPVRRTTSMSVDIVPKFSRTPSIICAERPALFRSTSVAVSDGSAGSVGRGSRNEGGALVLNLDDGH